MLTAIAQTAPVAPWLGGKRNLANRICAIIDTTPCTTYAEPFVGMGGIFLRRSTRPRAEVINDRGRDIANLFRILQRHYPQFIDCLRFQLTTRAEFKRLVAVDPDTLTDLERAARFLYLQRTAFGGKVSGRNFGASTGRPGRFNLTTLEPMLEDLHARMAGVVIGGARDFRAVPSGRGLDHLLGRQSHWIAGGSTRRTADRQLPDVVIIYPIFGIFACIGC